MHWLCAKKRRYTDVGSSWQSWCTQFNPSKMGQTSWYRRWERKERRVNFRRTIGVSTSQTRESEIKDGGWDSKKGHTYNVKDTSSRRIGGRTISFYPGGVCNVSNSNVVFGYESIQVWVLWLEKTTQKEPEQTNCGHKVDPQGVSRDLWCSKNLHQTQRDGAYNW